MTVLELATKLWGHMPKNEYETNYEWLQHIHGSLKDGGNWLYPDKGLLFERTDDGFVEKQKDAE